MGSFDYTCAISSLPIHAGDKVRYILVTENPCGERGSRACGPYDSWVPRTFPIKGEYNDYGTIETYAEGLGANLVLDGFKLDLITRGDNRYHDVPVSRDTTFPELLNAIRGGRVLVREYCRFEPDGAAERALARLEAKLGDKAVGILPSPTRKVWTEKPLAIHQVLIREDVWQALLKTPQPANYSTKKRPKLRDYRANIQKAYDRAFAHVGKFKDDPDMACLTWDGALAKDSSRQDPGMWMITEESVPRVLSFYAHFKLLAERCLKTSEDPKEVLNAVAEMAYVRDVSFGIRWSWRPSNSCGPQIGEFPEHERWHKALARICQDREVDRLAYWGDGLSATQLQKRADIAAVKLNKALHELPLYHYANAKQAKRIVRAAEACARAYAKVAYVPKK